MAPNESSVRAMDLADIHVLVVDDYEDTLEVFGAALQQFGANVLKARNAQHALTIIDMCITNRHYSHKRAGNSEAVMKDRRRSGRCRAFLVTRPSAVMSSSRLSGRPLASVALKWVQTNSSGLRSGA